MAQGFTQDYFYSLGRIAQMVNYQTGAVATGTTVLPADNTIPQITEGNEYMTLAITPQNVNNILKIEVTILLSNSSAISTLSAALFQDATANALAVLCHSSIASTHMIHISFTHWMTAGTTSPTTFRVRAGNYAAGTTTFNGSAGGQLFGGVAVSSITITEYMPQAYAQQVGQLQKARAYRAAAQSPVAGWQKVLIDTDSYDPDNITDLTNNRIIPTKAGYYVVVGQITTQTNENLYGAIYKNGAETARGVSLAADSGVAVSDIIYMNGSTDYVELYVYTFDGAALDVSASKNYLSVVGPF